MTREIKIRGATERKASTTFVSVPGDVLSSHYTARPVRVRSTLGACHARVLRRRSGEVVLMLSKPQVESLGLDANANEVELWIDVLGENLRLAPPKDLELALLEHGFPWNSIPERDRHLAIGLVKEARTTELRRARICKIVEALRGSES